MKVAVPTDGKNVSAHFGHCPQFTIADINDGQIKEKKVVENPGHQPGFLPTFLAGQGVECIIAGGMGQKAKMLFDEKNIAQILGIEGLVDDALAQYAKGSLSGGASSCQHGIDKTVCDHE